jgi:hypothetical protein
MWEAGCDMRFRSWGQPLSPQICALTGFGLEPVLADTKMREAGGCGSPSHPGGQPSQASIASLEQNPRVAQRFTELVI